MRVRTVLLVAAIALWPAIAGASALFLINGLGPEGAFTEPPSSAWRSLRLAAQEGFRIGVATMPFLSLLPALFVFLGRRFMARIGPDALTGAAGGLLGFALFLGWTLVEPLDPLLAGIHVLVGVVLIVGGVVTGVLITLLRPRTTPTTSAP